MDDRDNDAGAGGHGGAGDAPAQAERAVGPVAGLSHVTLVVRDLDRTEAMLTGVLGARRLYDSGGATFSIARERFFDVGGVWVATLVGEPHARRTYDHIAFRVEASDLEVRLQRIRALGLEVREGRPRVAGEGQSVYFYDDDNHLFELHAGSLEDRLRRYRQPPR